MLKTVKNLIHGRLFLRPHTVPEWRPSCKSARRMGGGRAGLAAPGPNGGIVIASPTSFFMAWGTYPLLRNLMEEKWTGVAT